MADAETELPKSVIKRLVKAHLDKLALDSADKKNYQLNADALLAFCESAKYFISYLTSAANDICKEKKRQTISADDIFSALDELEMRQFVAPLKDALEGFRVEQKDKNSKKAEQTKKRKSTSDGQEDAGEAGEPSPKQTKGDEEHDAEAAAAAEEDADEEAGAGDAGDAGVAAEASDADDDADNDAGDAGKEPAKE